jgi:flagellar hook-associated protein 1 FlgK
VSNIALNIAVTGIDASQAAMDTIAENLSNANTPGYVDETADLIANPGEDFLGVGTGVSVSRISQANDALLAANAQQTSGALAQTTALQQALQQAQSAFPEPSSSGLSATLASFWQDWDNIASNPSSSAPRAAVVDDAQTIVTSLQQASQQLSTTSANATSQLQSLVGTTNTLLSQVAGLNSQITEAEGSGSSPNSLIDQRNQLMDQLSTDIGATSTNLPNGTIQVNVGGVALVQGNWSDTIQLSTNGSTQQLVAQTSGATLAATSGTGAGLLAAVNQYIPGYQSQLNEVANSLATTVNTQLEAGFTATGSPGVALFTGSGAAGLSVNPAVVANNQLIAAASTSTLPDASNDGSNAQAVANLWNSPTGPDAGYQSLVQNVGDQLSSINNQVQSQTSVSTAAQENLQAVTGVNTNDQMTALLNFQNTYQAAAKVISTVDNAVQSLLSAV